MATGDDITISINGSDYSNYIDEYSESGGDNQVKVIRTFTNNYETIIVGNDDYELELNFRINSTQLKTLYENTSPVTIAIVVGSETTITYNNMIPKTLTYDLIVDDLAMGTLTYIASAYTNKTNNRVLS